MMIEVYESKDLELEIENIKESIVSMNCLIADIKNSIDYIFMNMEKLLICSK